jgi:hypothetical protein
MNIDEDGDMIPDVFMRYEFPIRAIRIINDHIVSSAMNFRFEMAINPDASPEALGLAWNKVDFWLDTLNQSVIVGAGNLQGVEAVISPDTHDCRFANQIVLMPGEPTEELIAYILQSKLNALCTDVMGFGPCEIESEETGGISYTVTGNPNEILPSMEAWMGPRNWFTAPWWSRDDGSTLDAQPSDQDTLEKKPEWAYSWEFLQKKPKPSGVVIPGSFKPRMVKDTDK